MKLRFISSALAAALFAATGSYAAVVDGGTIHFEGELVNAACSVNTDSANQVVTLGQYRTDIFNAVGNTSALIPFTIQLNDCDPVVAANAAVAFSGQADAINDNLLAIASSTNTTTAATIKPWRDCGATREPEPAGSGHPKLGVRYAEPHR